MFIFTSIPLTPQLNLMMQTLVDFLQLHNHILQKNDLLTHLVHLLLILLHSNYRVFVLLRPLPVFHLLIQQSIQFLYQIVIVRHLAFSCPQLVLVILLHLSVP